MIKVGLLTLGILLLAGCRGAPPPDMYHISRADFGAAWPFASIESGALRCEPGSHVVFRAPDGTDYAINGSARGAAAEEGWRDGVQLLSAGQIPAALQPLIDGGLELCPDSGK